MRWGQRVLGAQNSLYALAGPCEAIRQISWSSLRGKGVASRDGVFWRLFLLLLHERRPWYQQKLICTAVQSVGISRASIIGVTQTMVDQKWGYKIYPQARVVRFEPSHLGQARLVSGQHFPFHPQPLERSRRPRC
jgi:hypothetical protein